MADDIVALFAANHLAVQVFLPGGRPGQTRRGTSLKNVFVRVSNGPDPCCLRRRGQGSTLPSTRPSRNWEISIVTYSSCGKWPVLAMKRSDAVRIDPGCGPFTHSSGSATAARAPGVPNCDP